MYYYLIASLPTLTPGVQTPINYEEFLEMCKNNVSASVYERLKNLSYLSTEGKMGREWSNYYKRLYDELNYQRNLILKRPCQMPYERDLECTNTVNAALSAKNPYEAEKVLLEAEFKHLDSMVVMHNFDEYVLFGYAIKLRLLERQNCFNYEEGKKEFLGLIGSLQHQILNI